MEPKRFTKYLQVKLEPNELATTAAQMARIGAALGTLRLELEGCKARVKQLPEKIAELETDLLPLCETYSRGSEERPVECEEQPDFEVGVVRLMRLDTRELLPEFERALTQKERAWNGEGTLFDPNTMPPAEEGDNTEITQQDVTCICGHTPLDHASDGNRPLECLTDDCNCVEFTAQEISEQLDETAITEIAEATAEAMSQHVYEDVQDDGGTPTNTLRTQAELDEWRAVCAAQKIVEEQGGIKRIFVDDGPYVVTGTGPDFIEAYPVLPFDIVGSGLTYSEKSQAQETNEHGIPRGPMSYVGLKLNCGSAKKPDWWVIVGERLRFTAETSTAANVEISHADYVAFAICVLNVPNKTANAHARKLSLNHERDDDIRAWLAAGSPDTSEQEDDFTARMCGECKRIDGAHTLSCTHHPNYQEPKKSTPKPSRARAAYESKEVS